MLDIFLQVRKYPLQFISLSLILCLGGTFFILFSYNPEMQRNAIYATALGYLFWSIYHHYKRGDLHISIIVEYLVLILLALILVTQTLF